MRTCRADGEQIIASFGYKNWFSERIAQNHFSLAHVFGVIAFFEIRSLKFAGCFSHRISFVLKYESHWTDPAIVVLFRMEEAQQIARARNRCVPLNNIRTMKGILPQRHSMPVEKSDSPLNGLTK